MITNESGVRVGKEGRGTCTQAFYSFRTNPETKSKITDPEINSIQDVQEGQLLRGYVKCVQPHGVRFG